MFNRTRFIVCTLFAIVSAADAAEQPLSQSTIVVYNQNQADSVSLAKFYAQQRSIPRDHLVALDCSAEEEITRDEYESSVAQPLREIFKQRHWWSLRVDADGKEKIANSSIHFVAIIKGVPMKIRPTAQPYPGDEAGPGPVAAHNEASVDSELSVLAFGLHQISGAVPNPYFQSFRAIREFENATVLLVCRLDAPTPEMVRRMITDAIAAEKNGLWGRAYVDGSHRTAPGSEVADKWMADIVRELHKVGIPVIFDDLPAVFPDGFPMSDCALYYGWYAGGVTGPFNQPDFHFVPGAVAVHIHSFSASTLRDPNAGWVAPLIARGAAASTGNVYEPYLQLTPHLDVLNDRLLHGFTFGESAYMSIQALSWMSVMVGDPLYRPFSSWLQIDAARDTTRVGQEWKMYHEFAVKNGSRPVPEYRSLARQTASRARNGAMLEDLGLMELGEGNLSGAINYFQQARASYTKRDDILRVVLEQADALVKDKKVRRATDLIRSVLRVVPDAPASALLRKLERDATSPTPPLTH
ncbi:MAG: hypothetical protein QOI34_296 [Verrucomicrobiota bacterium]|jgi:uncharacterized protein (TIGR03790 family)